MKKLILKIESFHSSENPKMKLLKVLKDYFKINLQEAILLAEGKESITMDIDDDFDFDKFDEDMKEMYMYGLSKFDWEIEDPDAIQFGSIEEAAEFLKSMNEDKE